MFKNTTVTTDVKFSNADLNEIYDESIEHEFFGTAQEAASTLEERARDTFGAKSEMATKWGDRVLDAYRSAVILDRCGSI